MAGNGTRFCATHIAPRVAHLSGQFLSLDIFSYPRAVRKTPPSSPCDGRAIVRALDVWHDLRRGTHRVRSRVGRLTDGIGQTTVSKGYATMRAHTAPRPKQSKVLGPWPTRCTRNISARDRSQITLSVQRTRNLAPIARRQGGRFPHCLRVGKYVPVQRTDCPSAWRGAQCAWREPRAICSRREKDISKEVYCLTFHTIVTLSALPLTMNPSS